MEIIYSMNADIDPEQLCRLYAQTSWARGRTPRDVVNMLAHTALHVSAWAGDTLVGFARAISDLTYRALIDDVIVDEPLRGQGIGSELIRRIGDELREVDELFLGCGDDVVPFYRRHGFAPAPHACLKKIKGEQEDP